jgi:hypothetical protein
MAKKKKKKKSKRNMKLESRAVGPNLFPDAVAASDKAALLSTCRFLGKTFDEGEKICFECDVWVCSAGTWQKTGESC